MIPREDRINDSLHDKCFVCGGKFKAGDSNFFNRKDEKDLNEPHQPYNVICKNCASLEKERRANK